MKSIVTSRPTKPCVAIANAAQKRTDIEGLLATLRKYTTGRHTVLAIVLLVITAWRVSPAIAQPFLWDLQGLPISDEFNSISFAISADGSTIVGRGTAAQRAWRLRLNGLTTTFLGDLPGGTGGNGAFGVSADGSVVVGQSNSSNGLEAFRWTQNTAVMTGLGDLAGGQFESGATDVSDDGTVVVGYGTSPGGTLTGSEAFRWTVTDPVSGSGTMAGLGDLPGGDQASAATGVSANGDVVVGFSSSAMSGLAAAEAFRWQGGVMTALGDLTGGTFNSTASAVSADGSVVVGQSESGNGSEAFRWENGVMTGLGDLPGGNFVSVATAVSADGSVVVGSSAVAIGDGGLDVVRPFIWDATNGMRDLVDVFAQMGLTLPNLQLTSVTDISDDGTTFTGIGTSVFRTPAGDLRTEAWVGAFPEPSTVSLIFGAGVLMAAGRRSSGQV